MRMRRNHVTTSTKTKYEHFSMKKTYNKICPQQFSIRAIFNSISFLFDEFCTVKIDNACA